MDFLVCKSGLQGLELHIPLENLKDADEALSMARDMASGTKERSIVGLFTRDGTAICGWSVLPGGKLREETVQTIQHRCGVGPGSFEFAKNQGEARRQKRLDNL